MQGVSAFQNPFDFGISAYQNPFDFGGFNLVGVTYQQAFAKVDARIRTRQRLMTGIRSKLADPKRKAQHAGLRRTLAKYERLQLADLAQRSKLARKLKKKPTTRAPTIAPLAAPILIPKRPPALPTPSKREQALTTARQINRAEKRDTKLLASTKAPSRIIPLTDTTYLKFFRGNPKRKLAPSYGVFKKTRGADKQIGRILILKPRRRLLVKIRKPYKITREDLATSRSRMPPPFNSYKFRIKGRDVDVPQRPAPPPISPHVPPEAPPDATLVDYMGPRTPPEVQEALTENLPPPPDRAPLALPAAEQLETPPAPRPTFGPGTLPDVPETEKQLDRFFARAGAAGVGFHPGLGLAAFAGVLAFVAFMHYRARRLEESAREESDRIKAAAHKQKLEKTIEQIKALQAKLSGVAPPGWQRTVEKMKARPEITNPFALAWYMKQRGATPTASGITYDLRHRVVPTYSEWLYPHPVTITAGHDEYDDADEELAEMKASGFSKGWWQ